MAIADLSSRVLAERRRDFAPDSAGSFVLDSAAELVAALLEEAGVDRAAVIAVGVSVPAPVDSTTGVAGASTTLPWAGARPAAELERHLGLPVVVDNDADVAALGESTRGVARDAPDMVYMKFATGIGAGIILGGGLYRGASGIAGEIGQVIVDPDGVVCRCGNRGCLETVDLVSCLNRRSSSSAAIPTPRPSRCSTASLRRSAATPFRPRSRRCPSPPEPSGRAPRCSAPWPS